VRGVIVALAALVLAGTFVHSGSAAPSTQADAVNITSNITYNLKADEGAPRVSWDIRIVNNDPATSASGSGGVVRFYEGFSFPVLTGARNLSASSAGAPLKVSTSAIPGAPIDEAAVTLSSPLFYGESYSMNLSYEIADTRQHSLLVTPTYAFVPVVALGDTATVNVLLPPGAPWATELVPSECSQTSATFSCTGSDDIYLAALAEVSRPDLTGTTTVDVTLREKAVTLSIKFFQGEESFAQHVKDLAINALPVMEELYGVPYRGPTDIRLEERGRVITLGYEGLASCEEASCSIAVSPVAGDYTVLHELGHLWSSLYAKRWLQEGFAEFLAKEAAARMPAGLINGLPTDHQPGDVQLQLDQWGDVQTGIGVNDPQREIENAGYYRSERFLVALQAETGIDALKRANAAIQASGIPADSRRFMDALEVAGGGDNDDLFLEWVFPGSIAPTLSERRHARDRYSGVATRATEAGLSDTVPALIRKDLEDWKFADAEARLDEAEDLLAEYELLASDLERLRNDAAAAGLTIGGEIEEQLAAWHFDQAADTVAEATTALALYRDAQDAVAEPRNTWEDFGLIGSDPEGSVDDAAAAFNAGDYESASNSARDAINAVDDASATAARRVMLVAGAAAAFALLVLLGVWYTRIRERRAGQFG
jgi:hypothetical protein